MTAYHPSHIFRHVYLEGLHTQSSSFADLSMLGSGNIPFFSHATMASSEALVFLVKTCNKNSFAALS